ncbi:hypothetical protein NDU88_005610 [Pleurodeles waltl]|uniref:Uncharacterized protein n=1 Tax=Pleurodeles waltl TaxID=8319 RepID=A0AAV7MHF2_PLEWA|nr:hypothetical protein NDU88_005610 [Pleurodeles waltl]
MFGSNKIAVSIASTRQSSRDHDTTAIFRPPKPRLLAACTSGLRGTQRGVRRPQPDSGASRGHERHRYTLQWHVWAPGPVRYVVRRQSSSEMLLLGGHLGHAPSIHCLMYFLCLKPLELHEFERTDRQILLIKQIKELIHMDIYKNCESTYVSFVPNR